MRNATAATALIVCAATAASANTGHHSGGSGSGGGGSVAPQCLRWEPISFDMAGAGGVDMAGADMAGVDMAGVDMAGLDMAPARGDMAAPLRCAEWAGLFNCAFSPGAARDRDNALGLVLLAGIVVFEIWRARHRHRG